MPKFRAILAILALSIVAAPAWPLDSGCSEMGIKACNDIKASLNASGTSEGCDYIAQVRKLANDVFLIACRPKVYERREVEYAVSVAGGDFLVVNATKAKADAEAARQSALEKAHPDGRMTCEESGEDCEELARLIPRCKKIMGLKRLDADTYEATCLTNDMNQPMATHTIQPWSKERAAAQKGAMGWYNTR